MYSPSGAMSSSADSSSEDEDERRRRAEMASCVMSGADIVTDAAKPTRAQKKREPEQNGDCNDDDSGLTTVRSSGGIRRESERRLDTFMTRSLEIVDDAWNGTQQQKRICAPCSQLCFFTGSTALLPHQPPSIRTVLDAGPSERAGTRLLEQAAALSNKAGSKVIQAEPADGEAAEREAEQRAKKERKREKREKKERKREKREKKEKKEKKLREHG